MIGLPDIDRLLRELKNGARIEDIMREDWRKAGCRVVVPVQVVVQVRQGNSHAG